MPSYLGFNEDQFKNSIYMKIGKCNELRHSNIWDRHWWMMDNVLDAEVTNSMQKSMHKWNVAYNNAFRFMHHLPTYCIASLMFVVECLIVERSSGIESMDS